MMENRFSYNPFLHTPTSDIPIRMSDDHTPNLSAAAAQNPYRVRHDGWTAERKTAFIDALTRTGCVRDACRVVGISSTSAYRYRRRDEGFCERWDLALRRSKITLGEVAWKRAVEGEEEDVWYHGKIVGTRKKYANDVLRLLINRDDNGAGRDAAGRYTSADNGVGTVPGGAIGHEQQALPAPEPDPNQGPVPLPKGPITKDNLSEKLQMIADRAHGYGYRHINIKTGEGLTDEVIEGVQRYIARGRVELPKHFQWELADEFDAKDAEYLAEHRPGPGQIQHDG